MTAGRVAVVVPGSWSPVVEEVRPLAERFGAAGWRLYLVGGVVRDLVAGRPVELADLDFTTDARPPAIRELLAGWVDALWTQGERFGTIGATIGGRLVEVTTHRAEAYVADSRKPVVAFSDDVVADLSRRDFTVNAMAIELTGPEPVLIDPFEGRADLAAGRLRTPLAPSTSFSDDPLRMLRAARFTAGHGLWPVPELVVAATELADRLAIVSAERVRDELHKLVLLDDPGPGIELLVTTDLLVRVLPELAALDVAARTARVSAAASVPRHGDDGDVEVRLAALLTALPGDVVRRRLRALRHANRTVAAVSALVELAPQLWDAAADTDPGVRRTVHAARPRVGRVVELARALAAAGLGPVDGVERVERFEVRRAALAAREDLDAWGPPIDGDAVAGHLGLTPGPEVGAALDHLLEERIRTGPMSRVDALSALDRWWAERG